DQAKGWVIAHRARLFRLSQDRKFERERPRKERAGLNGLTADLSKKYDDRLRDWCHKAARMLVNFARRQKCGHIEYDDSATGLCPGLPWFKARAMTEQNCSEFNVGFVHHIAPRDDTGESVLESPRCSVQLDLTALPTPKRERTLGNIAERCLRKAALTRTI